MKKLILVLLLIVVAYASPFRQGIVAYKQKDYKNAFLYFKEASEAGICNMPTIF